MPSGVCCAVNWPSSVVVAKRESSAAGLMPKAAAVPCHAAGVACGPALANCPCAVRRPPAPVACSDWMAHCGFTNATWALRLCKGRRFWSRAPLRALVNCTWPCQPASAGRTLAWPLSRVWGAWGHRVARSSACQRALALAMGCNCQGLSCAVMLACSACSGGDRLAVARAVTVSGVSSATSASVASGAAKSPDRVAWASTVRGKSLDGTVVSTVPFSCTARAMGARACTRPLNW